MTNGERIESLYRDSVVTSQRRDEAEALYQNALAGERAAYEQYRMALDGAREQDRESARSMVDVARGAVGEVTALLQDARLTAPESGEIAAVYPERGELVGAGTPIMSLVVLEDAHAVLNVREDLMPRFRMGGTFRADVPALDRRGVVFREQRNISPLGSYATWRSTKQAGSYDLRTFELQAMARAGGWRALRPGMSALVNLERTIVRTRMREAAAERAVRGRAAAGSWGRMASRRLSFGACVALPLFCILFVATIFGFGPDGAHSGRRGRSGLERRPRRGAASRARWRPCRLSAVADTFLRPRSNRPATATQQ